MLGENVITGRYGTIGKVFYYNGECWPLNTALYVSDYHENLPRYVAYLLESSIIVDGRDKSTVPGVDRNVLHDIAVRAYTVIDEQQDAISPLVAIDTVLSINNQINDNLQAMLGTLSDYWFVQFEFPNEEGKPYRSSGGKMVWNERLKREIPDGWRVSPLSELVQHINTGLNPRQNFELGKGDIRYVTVKNLKLDGTIDFSDCDVVDEEARETIHARSQIAIGDILFASIAPLGRCYVIVDEPLDWDINESVFAIRPNTTVTSEYLYSFLTSQYFVHSATNRSTGSIFKGIRINALLDTLVVVPGRKTLDAYSDIAGQIVRGKHQVNEESTVLSKLRDWLLPMLMNGQATVMPQQANYRLSGC